MTIDRRTFLAASGSALAASALAPIAASAGARKTQRVVVVAFAGGVRTRETLGTPENVPNLKALADEGVVYPRARTANLGHYGAALSIFTGVGEPKGIRDNARGNEPTIFEYARKDLALTANDVWIATSGGAQQVNYAYGLHPDYGARFGANTLDGDGIFNKDFKSVLDTWGRPKELSASESEALAALRRALPVRPKEARTNSDATAADVERYLLDELNRGTADLTGANSADAKALRCGRNLLGIFKPKLLAIVLQDADIAHGSYNGYVEVVRRNDAALGELVAAVRADPALADSTAIFVCPEFGRDRDLNSRRGLDHGDGSEDLQEVACVAWGPEFRRGAVVKEPVGVVDVAPTVCEILGAKARHASGKKLPGLFA